MQQLQTKSSQVQYVEFLFFFFYQIGGLGRCKVHGRANYLLKINWPIFGMKSLFVIKILYKKNQVRHTMGMHPHGQYLKTFALYSFP